ncbi:Hcp family type VI secretion system effector [Erwinia sorbitola]|uniref:Type VI secretion system tube protein Hcp n=1 Tax=Erwinia sorbitola TaxID=2681984 RepID=A0ABW9RFG0_9GAMM|nr:Hcp family type VI secretion system effector [Erwinia sorbitola]MTD28939.1 type VI secretion system tube protein Hcp [Erwinia sorbitola]
MANIIYATIIGKQQGLISAGCSTLDSIGNKFQCRHEDQIIIYELVSHMTREEHVMLHPLEIRKPIDKSTPLLAQAITQNELLDCTFLFYRTSASGGIELYFKVNLKDATLCDIRFFYPNSLTHNEVQPQESVSFKYKSVTWEHVLAGTSAYSFWDDRVY